MTQPLAIVHTESSKEWGGQEIRVFIEMQAMRLRGYRMFLAAPKNSEIYRRCQKADFPVFAFSDSRLLFPWSIFRLKNFFRKENVRIVNTHSSRDSWIAGLAARWAKVPLILRTRHIDVKYPNRFLSRVVYRDLPHHIITTSQKIASNLANDLKLPSERITCIPTGIDLIKFDSNITSTLRQELNIYGNEKLVGMVSVIRSWKGHEYFIEAAHKISQQRTDVRFVIVGGGPMKEFIVDKIQSQNLDGVIQMLGHREDIAEVLAGLDVIVLPSYAHEGVPQILLQALAMNKPIVASRIGGIPEIIHHGENGLLVEPQNSDSLAEAMLQYIDDIQWARRLAHKGRAQIQQTHTIELMCQALEKLYAKYLRVANL
ncbi:MAG: glycosyltransferase family 4 protein [Verrucomicrobiota bacterium]